MLFTVRVEFPFRAGDIGDIEVEDCGINLDEPNERAEVERNEGTALEFDDGDDDREDEIDDGDDMDVEIDEGEADETVTESAEDENAGFDCTGRL